VALAGTPFAVTGFGTFIQRTSFRVRETAIAIPGLAPELAGFRIVQLSDIHLGPFLSAPELARAVAAANELQGDLAVITGDLISVAGDPLDECLEQLARLRSPHGLFGCLGNHELHAEAEDYTERAGRRRGIDFLRRRAVLLRIGGARLNLAGVDYQRTQDRPRYLQGCETLRADGALNILLSHNPDVFPAAVRKGFDLTLAGHTHGGQVTVEILEQTVNVARFVTPFVAGRYQQEGKSLYVSRGIGTIGMPTRLGAAPEITLLRLELA
jgi:predicted MPP superfamily phosphohydrolase